MVEKNYNSLPVWRDDRVAEGARLESVCTRKCTEGSNPSLSAISFLRVSVNNLLARGVYLLVKDERDSEHS